MRGSGIDNRLLFRGMDANKKWAYGKYIHKDMEYYIETRKHEMIEVERFSIDEIYRNDNHEKWFENDVLLTRNFPKDGDGPNFFVIAWDDENQRLRFMDMDHWNFYDYDVEIHRFWDTHLIGNTREHPVLSSDDFRALLKNNKTIMSMLESDAGFKKVSKRADFKQLTKAAHELRIKRLAHQRKEMERLKQQPDTYTDDLPF